MGAGGAPPARRQRLAPPSGGGLARGAAFVIGAGYVVAGLIGFAGTGFTGFVADTDEQLLGFFDLNIFHNVVHLAIGAALLLASRMRDVTITQGVLIGVGLFYILAAILGFLDELQIISINSGLSVDNFFHLATGLAAFLPGVIAARQQDRSIAQAPPTAPDGGPLPLEERRGMWAG